jgi:hypothetical protein
VHGLVVGREDRCDRVLRQPVDLEFGLQQSQLVGNGNVASCVSKTDG